MLATILLKLGDDVTAVGAEVPQIFSLFQRDRKGKVDEIMRRII